MKNFKSVSEWLNTNPSEDEMKKVIGLINRGAASTTRKEIWEKESYLRKLKGMEKYFNKLDMKIPDEISIKIKSVEKEINSLRKELPVVKVRAKKEEEVEKN